MLAFSDISRSGNSEIHRLSEKLVGLPCTQSNYVELLVDGNSTFDAVFEALKGAQQYVLAQSFIVRDDCIGRAFRDALAECAARGVAVYFMYDAIGSRKLPAKYVESLRQAGIHVTPFASAGGGRSRLQINFRNHRKTIVVDGRIAFIGGHNIGDEYMGRGQRFGPWRDTHVYVTGPAVQGIQLVYIEDWHSQTKQVPELNWTPAPSAKGNYNVTVIPSGPADEYETCHLFFLRAINSAQKRLWITSPYFVPDHAIVAALQLAALRGVDVRIMLPEKADHLLAYLSSHSYTESMHRAGAKLYRYMPGFMHQKVILIDDLATGVGTANLDNRSFYLNFEMMILVINRDFSTQAEAMLKRDFAQCRLVSPRELNRKPWWYKVAVRIARIASPLQ